MEARGVKSRWIGAPRSFFSRGVVDEWLNSESYACDSHGAQI